MKPAKTAVEVWGLTGGIAAGKSVVARVLADEGIPVLDADQVARELSQPGGRAHAAIQSAFGTADRSALRQMIFQDPLARTRLEAILHPMIREESEAAIARISVLGKPVIYEAALLVETGRYRDFSGLIVVEAPWENRKQRLIARDRISAEQAEAILRSQATDQERRAAATVVLENRGSIAELEAKVRELAQKKGWVSGAV